MSRFTSSFHDPRTVSVPDEIGAHVEAILALARQCGAPVVFVASARQAEAARLALARPFVPEPVAAPIKRHAQRVPFAGADPHETPALHSIWRRSV